MALVAAPACPDKESALAAEGGRAQSAEAPWVFGELPPGAEPFPPELVEELESAWVARDPGYEPRTRHLRPAGSPRYSNRLFLESSPYLRQHAHNPVDWYPWGDDAFAVAWGLDRPVLLSIGYSTCHWCHVMEEQSFEDEEIARYLNENYVVIKVDREERPDIDSIYMSAVRAMSVRGGWPLTVWLTPGRRPFHGGTYFPARDGDRVGRIGFLTVLRQLKAFYDSEPDRVALQAAQTVERLERGMRPAAGQSVPDAAPMEVAIGAYSKGFDAEFGGLGRNRKFPSSLPIRFLLRYQRRTGDRKALDMAVLTLERMAAGGIYDQIGGGFHRYSTDSRWLVPHFEKMLYDNALLILAYLEGYQVTGREDFAEVARETLRYVRRDMTSREGAFYSATDADSLAPSGDREEGWFFTWTAEEIRGALGAERSRVVNAHYGVTAGGNFEGRNILHTPRPLGQVAGELDLSEDQLRAIVRESRELLYAARALRSPPLRDEKILAAWNGLMISAFSRAALVLGDSDYALASERAADFLLSKLWSEGRLFRSYKDGRARHNAYLEDYAFVIAGLLDLYEATARPRWIREALALDEVLEQRYEDKSSGGFFMISDDHEELLVREKPDRDGVEPSGNSVHVMNLLRLHEFTGQDRFRRRAAAALRAFAGTLARVPGTLSEMLIALDFYLDTPKEVVILVAKDRREAEPFLERLRTTFLPNRVLTVAIEGEDLDAQAEFVPLLEFKVARGGRATAYVCENRICQRPTTDPEVFAEQIAVTRPLRPRPGS